MRLKTSTTIALAMIVSTVAMNKIDRKANGTVIPLTKRSPWSKVDNIVDIDALHSHAESVYAKMLRGLENYERNTGMSHSIAMEGTELLNLKKRAISVAPLESHSNLVWYTTITIGTPHKSFTVSIDTGSSDLFLPGPTCSSVPETSRWDPASSRTAEAKGSTFNLNFDDGATVSGKQYTDIVTIAGLSADVQTVGAAAVYAGKMAFPPDGILGLAFQPISKYPASPFFETLVDEGKVTEPVFSVKLTSDGGELYLGGKNSKLYQGEITYTPVTVVGPWQVNVKEIQGNGRTILEDIAAVIDTGSNVIFGDQSQVVNLHLAFGGKWVGRGFYSFPCNNPPAISFNFGGDRAFEIPASILNLGPVQPGSPDCFSGIVAYGVEASPSKSSKSAARWTVGAVFLQSVYTVFDFGNQQVGFANLV